MSFEGAGRPSTPSLFADALVQMTTLFETEIRLLRTEIGEKVASAFRAVAMLMGAAVLLLAALFLILIGCVEALVDLAGLPSYLAYLLVGIGIAIIGAIAVYFALNSLSAANLAPQRTFAQFSKDAEIVKEQVR